MNNKAPTGDSARMLRLRAAATWLLILLAGVFAIPRAHAATAWSTQDYDLYAGDFNGDGKTDLLYIAKDPSKSSGIALSDGTGPNIPFQSWPSNYLGIPWYGNHYTVIVADFNGDGHADIFLQSNTPGDSYLLLADSHGNMTGISQDVANNNGGVTWSADQHHIVAGDFNGDGKVDLFLQATSPSGLNAVMLADGNGQFTAGAPAESWNDGYLGFNWATTEALVYAGNFNGDGYTDLLIQARPKFVMIDFDVPFPVPTYPPNMNGVVLAATGGGLFQAAGVQAWSRNAFGVDWSPLMTNIIVGDFSTGGACPSCSGVVLQAKSGSKSSYLLNGNSGGTVFSAGSALASNVTWSADTYHLIAANFAGGTHDTGMYFQAVTAGGANATTTDVTGATVTTSAHDPAAPTGVVQATAVGRTPGSAAVSSLGSATYSIPIVVPPGVAAIQPDIQIAYSSSAPNGLLGVGWQITGMSEIDRCKRTVAEDGAPAAVQLSYSDVFCLDGNKLRLTGGSGYGADGATYQTELELFSRVTSHSAAGSGPAYFTVEGKDGLLYEYGNTTDSRILAAGGSTARTWALDKVSDRAGNAMTVSYVNDTANGSFRPQEMDYTTNSNAGLAASYKVVFVYENRPSNDILAGYVAGGLVRETQRLNHIETQYNDPQVGAFRLVRRYQLSYNTSGVTPRSRLEAVQECDRNSYCLSPTMISWQDGQSGWSTTDLVSGSDPSARMDNAYPIDVNGDGRTDLVYPQSVGGTYYWFLMLANSSGGFNAPQSTGIQAGDGVSTPFAHATPIDAFGNGLTSLLAVVPNYSTRQLLSWNGSTLALINTNISVAPSQGEWVGDFDGDGLQDFIYSTFVGGTSTIYVQRNQGLISGTATFGGAQVTASFTTPSNAYNPSMGPTPVAIAPDFNGDGRTDLIWVTNVDNCGQGFPYCSWTETIGVLLSNGTTFTPSTTFTCSGHWTTCGPPLVGDFNGDGLSDLLVPTSASVSPNFVNYGIAYGTGAGVTTTTAVTLPALVNLFQQNVADLDGDGRADLFAADAGSSSYYWLRFNGTDFDAEIQTGLTQGTNPLLLDLDGDGLVDIGYQNSQFRVRKHAGAFPDLVGSVTDGFGNSVSFSYAPLTNGAVYTKGSAAQFPDEDVQLPTYVVSSYAASDGVGGNATFTESYTGARTQLQGRGHEGFASRAETDNRTGIQTSTLFNQQFPFIGTVNTLTVKQPNGHMVSQLGNSYLDQPTSTTPYSDRHVPYIRTKTETRYEVSASSPSIDGQLITLETSVTSLDSYGNTTGLTVTTADETGSGLAYTTSISNSFNPPDITNWCVSILTQQQITKVIPVAVTPPNTPSSLTRTVQHVPDSANPTMCRDHQKIIEPTPSASSVTSTYGYDAFGHVHDETVSASGQADRITTTDYGAQGVFVTTLTDAESETVAKTYDYALGVPVTQTDPNQIGVSWSYDGFGRRASESRPDGTSTLWTRYACTVENGYCGDGLLRYEVYQQQYDSNSNAIGFGVGLLDSFDRVKYDEAQSLSGATSLIQTNFDNMGRVYQNSAPYFAGFAPYYTTYGYDLIGRLLTEQRQVSETDHSTETTQYGYALLAETRQDANAHTTTQRRNALGQIVQVTDPSGGTTSYLYEPFGNLGQATDPAGNQTKATFNVRGFKMTVDDPDMGHWGYTYYPTGELWTQTDAKANQITFTYDRVGRALTRSEPEGLTSWSWGSTLSAKNIGQLSQVSSPGGYQETYTYDTLGRQQDVTTTIDGSNYVLSRAYDPVSGFLSSVTYPSSTAAVPGSRFEVQYNYQNGLLQSVADASNPGAVFWQAVATNAAGQTIDEQYGNALHTYSTYDAITQQLAARSTGTSGQVQNLAYQWDKVGNFSERKDVGLGLQEDFYYDARDRLDHSTLTVGSGSPSTNLSMGYDATGNILSKSDVGSYDYTSAQAACSYTGLTAQPHGVRKAGGTSYCYDADGNMTLRGSDALSWTSYRLPSQVNQGSNYSQFFYGAARARYKEVAVTAAGGPLPAGTETTLYVGGLFERVTKPSGVVEYKHYVIAATGPIAIRTLRSNGVNDTRYLHKDHLGGVDTITDESGNIVLKLSFDAFGKRRSATTWSGAPAVGDWSTIAAITHRGFTFHEQLDNVGLIHMNGRVDDPTTGRFVSADPIVQSIFAAQSLNRYSYVMNNPVSLVDPSGFDGEDAQPDSPSAVTVVGHTDRAPMCSGCRIGWGPEGQSLETVVVTAPQTPRVTASSLTLFSAGHWIDYASHVGEVYDEGGIPVVPVTARRSKWVADADEISGLSSSSGGFLKVANKPTAQLPRGYNVNLLVHELAGGHTIALHVAKTIAFLRNRTNNDPDVSTASTFFSLQAATGLINKTLNEQRVGIAAMMAIEGEASAVITAQFDRPTGHSVSEDSNGYSTVYSVTIVLQKPAATPEGFLIVTAFPMAP